MIRAKTTKKPSSKIRVVIVDDSRMMRALLRQAMEFFPDIDVVGSVEDPFQAREVIRKTNPDVVTLDVEMPRMNGLEFLEKIIKFRPLPVIMVSSLTSAGADITFQALDIGAVDFVTKPTNRVEWDLFSEIICRKISIAARANVTRPNKRLQPRVDSRAGFPPTANDTSLGSRERAAELHKTVKTHDASASEQQFKLIAIGASTGGVTAIGEVLHHLPPTAPPVVIAQHMPPGFTKRFAARLAQAAQKDIAEAQDGEPLTCGMVRIAPGDQHLLVANDRGRLTCLLEQTQPISGHRPSVDVLFHSVAVAVGRRAVGAILTGMGSDGALGLREMRQAGATTYAQSENTCVVYGMPRAAVKLGAVDDVLDIGDLAKTLIDLPAPRQIRSDS
ncbi:MAG: chemotaxis response regulator protein-glutamate methylesterase [Alphaproteobacteria bacterium]|nr:chemotaxis response regulator protein-glutamate methylesterase [Alphaproteobacteria bacterium]